MNHANPILIVLLALWLCIAFLMWAAPRFIALTIALTGEIVTFLIECAHEVYNSRQFRGAT